MQTTRRTLIVILLVLLFTVVSCQNKPAPGSDGTGVEGTSAPAGQAQPAPETTKVSSGAAGKPGEAAGQFVLETPDQGVAALQHYRQRFTSSMKGTYKGQPYSYSEVVERTVSGTDQTGRLETTTNGEAFYLYLARMGDTVYSQSNPQAPCRAASAADSPVSENPARKLPPVYGASMVNHEPINGAAAVYYKFDARSVPHAAGKNDQAAGELWTSDPGGILLRYDLTAQVKEGDFTGEREWHYTLEVGDFTTELPPNCLLLLDLPIPPGAWEVVNQPGFTRYTVNSGYEAVRQFYLSALPELGWEPLPPTRMGPDESAPVDVNVLTFAKGNADGSGQVAVIQLNKDGATVKAAVQVIQTKSAVVSYDPTKKDPAPEAGDEEPSEPEKPSAAPKLPEDFPVYVDGNIVMQNESMMMLTTPDDPETVVAFYEGALEESGWEKAQDTTVQGTWMQLWEKGPDRVMIVITRQGEETTVVISPD